jgi:RNA 2',3'-cyclic 3'-phosphodiesterase
MDVAQQGVPGFDAPDDDAVRNVFFALKPGGTVADSIVAAAHAITSIHSDSAGRALKRHRLHMTMLYIGSYISVPEQTIEHALKVGDDLVASAFDLPLDIAGSFRNHDLTWWLGCSQAPVALGALHRQLYTGLGLSREKPSGGQMFTPHVSIVSNNRQVLPTAPIAPIHWHVDELCLIDSVMGESNFRILKTWKLGERADG